MFLLNYIYRPFILRLVRASRLKGLGGGGEGLLGGVLESVRGLGQ